MRVTIREGESGEVGVLAEMFRRMWLDNGVDEAEIVEDWRQCVESFVEEARQRQAFRFFVAEHDGRLVGCAACQRFAGLYPAVLKGSLRRYGYVWGVYVEPEHRRSGLGEMLTARCVDALRDEDCTHVLLHAAPMAERLYERLGFESTNEMRLPLS